MPRRPSASRPPRAAKSIYTYNADDDVLSIATRTGRSQRRTARNQALYASASCDTRPIGELLRDWLQLRNLSQPPASRRSICRHPSRVKPMLRGVSGQTSRDPYRATEPESSALRGSLTILQSVARAHLGTDAREPRARSRLWRERSDPSARRAPPELPSGESGAASGALRNSAAHHSGASPPPWVHTSSLVCRPMFMASASSSAPRPFRSSALRRS
jgi:hypothetical protein